MPSKRARRRSTPAGAVAPAPVVTEPTADRQGTDALETRVRQLEAELAVSRARNDELVPIKLADAAPMIGFKKQTIHCYMMRPEKRELYMLDMLFFRIGKKHYTTKKRMREWSDALSMRREAIIDGAKKEVLLEEEKEEVLAETVSGIGMNG